MADLHREAPTSVFSGRAWRSVDRAALARTRALLAATCRREAERLTFAPDPTEREHLLDVAAIAEGRK